MNQRPPVCKDHFFHTFRLVFPDMFYCAHMVIQSCYELISESVIIMVCVFLHAAASCLLKVSALGVGIAYFESLFHLLTVVVILLSKTPWNVSHAMYYYIWYSGFTGCTSLLERCMNDCPKSLWALFVVRLCQSTIHYRSVISPGSSVIYEELNWNWDGLQSGVNNCWQNFRPSVKTFFII